MAQHELSKRSYFAPSWNGGRPRDKGKILQFSQNLASARNARKIWVGARLLVLVRVHNAEQFPKLISFVCKF